MRVGFDFHAKEFFFLFSFSIPMCRDLSWSSSFILGLQCLHVYVEVED